MRSANHSVPGQSSGVVKVFRRGIAAIAPADRRRRTGRAVFASVVLLVRHNEEGALGLILNRRTNASLKETWARLSEVPCHRDEALYLGGPCEGPLVALHTHEFLLEIEVMPGCISLPARTSWNDWRPRPAAARQILRRLFGLECRPTGGRNCPRLVVGAAGPAASTCSSTRTIWLRTTRQVADAALRRRCNIKHAPPDPR